LGQVVTIRHTCRFCEIAGAENVAAAAVAAAVVSNFLLFIDSSSGFVGRPAGFAATVAEYASDRPIGTNHISRSRPNSYADETRRPRVNLKQLETFYWAAKLSSFTAAAARVNSTQSTVSMRIHELEQEFGVELFDRSQRTVRVTALGREMIRYAEQMLHLSAEMRERIAAPESIPGVVRVGVAEAISVTWLPQFIRTLHERHPKIVLELDEALTEELFQRLREGQLDLILAPGRLPGYGLLTRSLGVVRMGWMASPALEMPAGRLDPQALQLFPIIALSRQSVHHAKIEDWFRSAGAFGHRLYTCKSFGVASSLAAAGLGVTLLPLDHYRGWVEDGRLRVIDVDPPMAPVEFTATIGMSAAQPLIQRIAELARATSTFEKAQDSPPAAHLPSKAPGSQVASSGKTHRSASATSWRATKGATPR
jgi:DNA-binding transcriptional LysR family regulator